MTDWTKADTARVKELDERATAGPWTAGRTDLQSYLGDGTPVHRGFLFTSPLGADPTDDALFSAEARMLLPRAAAEIERLQAERESNKRAFLEVVKAQGFQFRRAEKAEAENAALRMELERLQWLEERQRLEKLSDTFDAEARTK